MDVACIHGPADLRLTKIAAPAVHAEDVLLRTACVGICGSDLGYVAKGGIAGPASTPIPLGHELSGIVEQVGSDVRSVVPGDRVVLNPLPNLIGNGGPEGGFASRLLVRDVASRPESLLRLPDTLSLEQGALVEPLAVALHAIRQLGAAEGDKVAIFGAGPIGLAAVAILRQMGVTDIVVLDLSPFRRERAMQMGAAHAVDPRDGALSDLLVTAQGAVPVLRRTGPATTHYLEASGAPVLPDIFAAARVGAHICTVGGQKAPVPVDFMTVMAKELHIVGALGYPTEFPAVIAMLETGVMDMAPFVSHHFDGADILAAFDTARQADIAAKVLVHYSG